MPPMILLFGVSICYISYMAYRRLSRAFYGREEMSQIPGPESHSWLKGNMGDLFNRQTGPQYHNDLVDKYDRVAKVHGFFGEEQLYISDPVALNTILNRDQEIYEETAVFTSNNKIIFGEGLVATVGEHHKRQRKLITPVFSVARLRQLVPIFYDVASRLRTALIAAVESNEDHKADLEKNVAASKTVDLAEWLSRAALESIGMAGLGYSMDPLNSVSTNPYTKAVRDLIPTLFSISLLRLLTPFVTRLGPPGFRRFLLNFVPIRAVQKVKRMSDVMDATCRDILLQKRSGSAGEKDAISWDDSRDGKDVMSVLLTANEGAHEKERLSDAELLGQMNVLIFGAQDTTSSALSRIMHLLAGNETLQEDLRREIVEAYEANGGRQLDWDQLLALPLLDVVIRETLRLYPPVPFVRRVATRDAVLPLSRPILLKDGTMASQISVPCGTTLWLSISGVNRSEDIWSPDAADWRPNRWLDESHRSVETTKSDIAQVQQAKAKLPGIYPGMLTFLGGGRSCVGYRFALIEMKIILCTLLTTFTFRGTKAEIVWNLSQILSPSVRTVDEQENVHDTQGLPLNVTLAKYKM